MNKNVEAMRAYVASMQKHINQLMDENEKLKVENEIMRKALSTIMENFDDIVAHECASDALRDAAASTR